MAIRLEAGWDSGEIGDAAVTIVRGATTFTLTMDAGGIGTSTGGNFSTNTKYSHVPWGAGFPYASLSTPLAGALNAATAGTFVVTRPHSIWGYQIQNVTGTFTMTFNGAAGARMRGILGFQGNRTADSVQPPDARSWYVIPGAFPCWSQDSGQYNEGGRSEGGFSMGGQHYQVSSTAQCARREFRFPLEPRAKVFREYATVAAPWTFEDFFAHAGEPNAFQIKHDGGDYAFTLHPSGADFDKGARKRVSSSYDDHWHVDVSCWADGKL